MGIVIWCAVHAVARLVGMPVGLVPTWHEVPCGGAAFESPLLLQRLDAMVVSRRYHRGIFWQYRRQSVGKVVGLPRYGASKEGCVQEFRCFCRPLYVAISTALQGVRGVGGAAMTALLKGRSVVHFA
jgi:hypothetical protein